MSLRDGRKKMSKSDPAGNRSRILITDDTDSIVKKIKQATTDSEPKIYYDVAERPHVANLIDILRTFCDFDGPCDAFLRSRCLEGVNHASLKQALIETLVDRLGPIREMFMELKNDPCHLDSILRQGTLQADEIATRNVDMIKRDIGL